jgi:hypothetical protein
MEIGISKVSQREISLEDTMLNEISQAQEDKYHMFSLRCGS